MNKQTGLLSLPNELLIHLTHHLHNVEDYANLSSTCRKLRNGLAGVSPRTMLRLAHAQEETFFRPHAHYLVAAVARQLGEWARQSSENEAKFAEATQEGLEGLLWLARGDARCGLTMARIREMHQKRLSIFNPVANIIGQCESVQWHQLEYLRTGGLSGEGPLIGERSKAVLHLAIYGELFGPDLNAFASGDAEHTALTMDTRLAFGKHCIPYTSPRSTTHAQESNPHPSPRGNIHGVGPSSAPQRIEETVYDHKRALYRTLISSGWCSRWKCLRTDTGRPEFTERLFGEYVYPDPRAEARQRLWECLMLYQGMDGLRMIVPNLENQERDLWLGRVKDWRQLVEQCSDDKLPTLPYTIYMNLKRQPDFLPELAIVTVIDDEEDDFSPSYLFE